MKISHFLILAVIVSCVSTRAFAQEFKLKSGQVYEGNLIDSDNQSVYIETNAGAGLVNVPKKDLVELPAGVAVPKAGVALKPAWGKKNMPGAHHAPKPSVPSSAPASSSQSASNGETYHEMSIAELQKQADLAKDPEEKEMFRKAAAQAAFHQAATHQSQKDMDLQKTLQKNPATGWAINWSLETAAKANLRKIHSAAAMFEADKNKPPQSMQELIASGMLDAEFKSAVQSYNFNIIPEKEGVMVQATPADATAGLGHFTLNPKGKIESAK